MAGRGIQARRDRLIKIGIALVVLTFIAALLGPSLARAAPSGLDLDVSGTNGSGRIDRPGIPCAEGGEGAAWHYEYGAPLAGGIFSALKGDVRMHLNLHSQAAGAPQATYSGAWLPPGQSYATIGNTRGVVRLALAAGPGTCGATPLSFNGTTAAGSGTWSIPTSGGSGSYRGATGSGTFTLFAADVAPGADNPFRIKIHGSVDVPLPSLGVEVAGTYWGFAGVHYALRIVTVIYKITNTGPGDAFGVRLTSSTSPTPGVTPLGPVPQVLGDLRAGESELVRLRYQFSLTEPCDQVILGCEFDSTLQVEMPDALDRPGTYATTVRARAPDFPPPA